MKDRNARGGEIAMQDKREKRSEQERDRDPGVAHEQRRPSAPAQLAEI